MIGDFVWFTVRGRSESILMSLPPDVMWSYDELSQHPDQKTLEEDFLFQKLVTLMS